MPNRHTDQERWEVLLMTILLKYRPILFIGGGILVLFALASAVAYPVISVITSVLALMVLTTVFSDWATLFFARFLAWMFTIGRH